MNAKYVYCVLDSRLQEIDENTGLNGCKLYCVSYEGISAIISDVQKVDYNANNLLLHESVNEGMMRHSTVLPMRFGTVMSSDAKVKEMLERYFDDFNENFLRLAGQVEMGVKVIWPVDEIKKDICSGVASGEHELSRIPAGIAYLKRRMKEIFIEEALKEKADKMAWEVDEILRPYFVDHRVRTMVTEKMAINSSYMVFKNQAEMFRRKASEIKLLFPDIKILVSGPWPPYNFIRLRKNEAEKECEYGSQ